MKRDLIFDLGMHRGEDTEFYLKKGFRVVAVEAEPDLAASARVAFAGAIADGRLVVVNKAIAPTTGRVTLYRNRAQSVWHTLDAEWAERNARRGYASEAVEIEAVTLGDLFAEHGVPYYLKIDIEGMDLVALEALTGCAERPKYVSIESDKTSMRALRREFTLLQSLGYDRFKLVNQHHVVRQREPNPPLVGAYSGHRFAYGASGLFGDEAPGPWLGAEEAIAAYRPVFLRYALVGDDALLPRWLVKALRRLGYRANWYDTHAALREGV